MHIISWNVAGYRACLKKGFSDFFDRMDADIVCLQEIKATKEQLDFKRENYFEFINSAERKGYSGVMIYSKIKPLSINYGMNIDIHDHEGRLITLEFDNFYLVTCYTPNSKRNLERLSYRQEWEDDFRDYLHNLKSKKEVILCGDLNVAHNEIDIKNAKQNIGNSGFTHEEREKFTKLLDSGFIDTFRYLNKDRKDSYTWWSYMRNVREKNIGWRIDYFLISDNLKSNLKNAYIYSDIHGSDHCPIGIDIEI